MFSDVSLKELEPVLATFVELLSTASQLLLRIQGLCFAVKNFVVLLKRI
jgi:hypothetical protein